jgi:hypothetical protein
MQIRERGKSVRLIRNAVDKETQLPVTEVLAKLKHPELVITDEDRAKLTPNEIEEFEAFKDERRKTFLMEREIAAKQLLGNIELTIQYMTSAPKDAAVSIGTDLLKPIKKLRRQIETLINTGDEPSAD